MRLLVQRVSQARVVVAGETIGAIGRGLVVLVGFTHGDGEAELALLTRKLVGLRIFEDEAGLSNLDLEQVGGGLLLVPQFTLYADCRRGRRPSFTPAAQPEAAEALFARFVEEVRESGLPVECGRFGAEMQVELRNDGPFTILLDSEELQTR